MNLLITGALGHIGSALVRELPHVFSNPQIYMIDDLSTQRYCSLFNLPEPGRYRFIESKVQTYDLEGILQDIDVVIHLAALTDAAGTADQPEKVHQNNFEATCIIAEACLKHTVPLIFPSSTSVYGSQSNLVDETCAELQPQSPYADCKIKEEALLKELFQAGLKGTICRLGTIYGVSPGMRFHTAVNKFCWQAVLEQEVTVWETALDQRRPYLALQDSVRALCWITQKALYTGEIYNIVSANHTVREVIEAIQTFIPHLRLSFVKHKIMNQLSYEVSCQKFAQTGFDFSGNLGQGIEETIHILRRANTL